MEEYSMNPIIKQIQNAIAELQELLAAIEMLGDNTPALLYQLANEKSQAITDATLLLANKKGEEEQPPIIVETQEKIAEIEEDTPLQTVEKDTPLQTVEEDTPTQTVEEDTPPQTIEKDTPTQTVEEDTPLQTVEEDTPTQTVEEVPPIVEPPVPPTVVAPPIAVEPTPITPSAIERKELRKSLTLNDRFLFRRELFANSDAVMREALDAIHQCATHALALKWIEQHYSWDAEAPAVIEFMALLEKNYNTK